MMWGVWGLDHATWGWIGWLAFFAVWEAYTGIVHPGQMLTDHLRPLFHAAPVTWYLALGIWLWLGPHILAPSWEAALVDIAWRRP